MGVFVLKALQRHFVKHFDVYVYVCASVSNDERHHHPVSLHSLYVIKYRDERTVSLAENDILFVTNPRVMFPVWNCLAAQRDAPATQFSFRLTLGGRL